MKELRVIGEIEGFDRVLYKSPAQWNKFNLSIINNGKAKFEIWSNKVSNVDDIDSEIIKIKDRIERFKLSIEWAYGHKLKYKILDIIKPSFTKNAELIVVHSRAGFKSEGTATVLPRKVPTIIPQVPLEAKLWIQIWIESTALHGYVEEQLRRQYLIIEELWQELHHIFDENERAEKIKIKLIRDFVSHASCDSHDIVSLIKPHLPSAVQIINGKERVSFNRTIEHRNYISFYEVTSREMARRLVNYKMKQIGVVSNV